MKATAGKAGRRRAGRWPVLMLAVAGTLVACEARLNLDGVRAGQASPVRRSDLFQAAATNGKAIVVVGNHGLVVRSVDDGLSWARQELPGWPALIDLAACPGGRFAALATEGQVLVSTDDGQTWIPNAIQTEESPQGITCDPDDRLWVVGSFSTIIVSDDGGQNWDDRSIGEDMILTSIQFVDAARARILGEFGTHLHTTDGGETWVQDVPLPDEFYPQDALFTDFETGWVSGLAGQILHTTDGGASWAQQQTPTLAPVYTLVADGADIYAAGGEGVLLKLDGDRWRRFEHGKPVRLFLRVLHVMNGQRLLIGGAGGAFHIVPAGGDGGAGI